MGGGNEVGVVKYRTVGGRILQQSPKNGSIGQINLAVITHQNLDVERRGAGMNQINGLRVAKLRYKKSFGFFLSRRPHAVQHRHGFGSGGGFVQQRGVGNFHARQVNDQRLKIQEHFQASLRNFGLVGRVGRVPRRIFQHVPQNYVGRNGVVITRADIRFENLILLRQLLELFQKLRLTLRRGQLQRPFQANGRWNGLFDELIEAVCANGLEHFG